MQLRRFTGDSMPGALAAVRETLGAEAIIVSNREVNGRIELIATGTIDEETLSGARDAEPMPEPMPAPMRPMPEGPEETAGVSVSLSAAAHGGASSVSVRSPGQGAGADAGPTAPKPDVAPPAARGGCDADVVARSVVGITGAEAAVDSKGETRAAVAETRSVIDDLTRDLAAMSEEERPLLLDSAPAERARELDCDRPGTVLATARPVSEAPTVLAPRDGRVTPEPGSSTVLAIAQVLAGAERRHAERARRLEQRLGRLEVNLWGELEPLKAAHLRQLVRLGIGMELAVRLIERIGPGMSAETAMRQSLALLKSTLLTGVDGTGDAPGVTVLSGPAGGGKTTALAKLAIRQVREAGNQSLVMISADNRRIGAFESLQVYGRLLGVPVLRVRDSSELAELLLSLSHKPLVLVDHVPLERDDALSLPEAARLGEFEGRARALRHLLVLPATLEARAFESEVVAHRAHGITHGVLTQLDRATRIAACFAPLVRHRLPLAWLSDDDCVRSPLTRASGTSLVAAATTIGWRTAASADESFMINLMQPTRSLVGEPSAGRTETGTPQPRTPETSAQEGGTPVTSTPGAGMREMRTPVMSASETRTPETSAQEGGTPETSTPETSASETSAQERGTPTTSTPATSAPATSAPETSAQERETPATSARPAERDERESDDEAPPDPSPEPVVEAAGEAADRVDAGAADEDGAADEGEETTDVAASRDARVGHHGRAPTRQAVARGERLGSYGLSILATRSRRLQEMETGTTR